MLFLYGSLWAPPGFLSYGVPMGRDGLIIGNILHNLVTLRNARSVTQLIMAFSVSAFRYL